MNWETVITASLAAIGGSGAAIKILGDRLLLKQKAKLDKEILELQNAFSMGINSHMATVIFDKHMAFCEEYVEAASKALYALIQEGVKVSLLDAREFLKIRQKWSLWLTREIEDKLDRFEENIAKIGGEAQVLDANGDPPSNEKSIKTVIAELREVLATERISVLRSELIVRSSEKSTPIG